MWGHVGAGTSEECETEAMRWMGCSPTVQMGPMHQKQQQLMWQPLCSMMEAQGLQEFPKKRRTGTTTVWDGFLKEESLNRTQEREKGRRSRDEM